MSLRIFIKFRTDQVPGPPAEKDILVAAAACTKLLGRVFDFKQDFVHAQGEILTSNARCHVLVDCNYHSSQPDPKNTSLYFYKVVRKEASLLALQFSNCVRDNF